MFCLCLLFGVARSQTVAVADVEALPGETVEFSLNLSGGKADSYTALSFDVQFPADGFTTTGSYAVSESWTGAMAVIGDVDATGLATIPFASSNAIVGSDVEKLVSVSFKVGESVPTGVYDVTLKNIMFEYGVSDKDYVSDVTFQVNVVDKITLDENALEVPKTRMGVDICVHRTINAGEWSTICLPFAMTAEQVSEAFGGDVELAEFVDYEMDDERTSITINFEETDLSYGFQANYPYLIKTSSDISEFTVTSTIEPDEENAVAEYAVGRGTKRHVYGRFIGSFHANTTVPAAKLFISNNKFYYSRGATKMKGYRAYFDLEDVIDAYYGNSPQQAPIRVMLNGHDDFTAIDVVDMNIRYQEGIYTLSGMKVKNAERGVFIKNGKKYTLK